MFQLISRKSPAFVACILMASSCFIVPPAIGQTTRYDSQSDLLAAISNPAIIGFDGIAPPGGAVQLVPITIDGIHFSDGSINNGNGCVLDPGFNNESLWGSGSVFFTNAATAINATLDNGQHAVGFEVFDELSANCNNGTHTPAAFVLNVDVVSGSTDLGTYSVTTNPTNTDHAFIGFTSLLLQP